MYSTHDIWQLALFKASYVKPMTESILNIMLYESNRQRNGAVVTTTLIFTCGKHKNMTA